MNISKHPIGVPFLDRFLEGGHQGGQQYGLLGPIGVGKTTLGTMIASQGALREKAAADRGEAWGVWCIVSVDTPIEVVQQLVLSDLGRISRQEHKSIDYKKLCSGLQGYEHDHIAEIPHKDGVPLGEQQRYEEVCKLFGRQLNLLDFLPEDFMSDPVSVISNRLENELGNANYIAGIVVDYVGLIMNRHLRDSDIPAQWRAGRFKKFVEESRCRLAQKFGCPVWLIHQLNGNANKRSPVARQHHRDAKETKHFGDHLDYCFVLGTQDPNSRCFTLECTKALTPPIHSERVILEIDRDFAILRESKAMLDFTSQRIHRGKSSVMTNDDSRAELLRLFREGEE